MANQPAAPAVQALPFLAGGGEMGERMRALDWAGTPLGKPEQWPAALRTTVRILLTTGHPAFLFWGPQHLCFYNDAYSRSLGPEQHPAMLGQSARAAWAEIWPIIGPQIEQVMSGGAATWHENQLVPFTRDGQLAQVYWTYSYSPVHDDSVMGGVGGVLVLVTETTQQHQIQQSLREEQARWLSLFDQAPGFICVLAGPQHRYEYVNARYRSLLGGRNLLGKTVLECVPEARGQGFIELLDEVLKTGQAQLAHSAPLRLLNPGQPTAVLRHVDFVYQPIRDAAGTVTGVFVEGHDVSEQATVAQALQDTLFSITDGFAAFDDAWRFVYLNPAAESMLGVQPGELLGRSHWEAFPSLVGSVVQAEYERAAAGEVRAFECLFDAWQRWFRVRCYPRRGGGVVSYFQDISAEKAAEAERQGLQQRERERNEELNAVMNSAQAFIWIAHDRDCVSVTGNAQSYTLLRMAPGDNVSATALPSVRPEHRPFTEYLNGKPADPKNLPLQQAARTGVAVSECEIELVFDDGSVRHLLGGAAPLYGADGQVRGAVATFVESTDFKRALAQLQLREAELRTLADNTPDVLARYDREHRHVFVNASIEKATGRTPQSIIGLTNAELGMPAELCAMWWCAVEQAFVDGQPGSMEFSFEGPRGLRSHVARLVPEFGAGAQAQHVLAIIQDVTEQRQAEAAVRMAEQRKDEFLATLAHELRNPLAPLRTGLQVLERVGDGPHSAGVRAMMERQLKHMVRLVDDLLDVSRISVGKMNLYRETVSLQMVAEAAIEACRPQLDAARHRLFWSPPPVPVWVHVDVARLVQVIGNMLSNACRYTAPGGDVRLTIWRDGQLAQCSLADNGMGIPPAMLNEVFQMFAQVNGALDRTQGGLGIGLALARSIIELHQGQMQVHSAGLGHGSVFSFSLPAIDVAAPLHDEVEPSASDPASAHRHSYRVLVVDDNRDAADSLVMLLRDWGHDAQALYDGEPALRHALVWSPHAMFIDIGMSGMNGLDLARELRSAGSRALLIALTGWGTELDQQRTGAAGFDVHLTKPAASQSLAEALDRLH